LSLAATATPASAQKCNGNEAAISGTAGDDRLQGTPGTDAIEGRTGDDRISGLDGIDLICGSTRYPAFPCPEVSERSGER
jgi:hypothetical protein